MPRKPRQGSPAGVYHFITRGINKKKLFHKSKDYQIYLNLIEEYRDNLDVQIYHYCLMPNHVHILLKTSTLSVLSRFAYFTQRRYAYYYLKAYSWSGQVFRRNFISVPIADDGYLLECGRYIERNPVKANLVTDPKDYPYTSYPFYALGEKNSLVTESPLYPTLGRSISERRTAYRFYIAQEREEIAKMATQF